jgi:hypothetical protein
VCLVSIPHLMGKNGRRLLFTWLIAITISGPFDNMQENIREASLSFVCFKQLAQNRTSLIHNLVNGPMIQTMKNLKKNEDEIRKIGSFINDEGLNRNKSESQKSAEIADEYRSILKELSDENVDGANEQLRVSCAPTARKMKCEPERLCQTDNKTVTDACKKNETVVVDHCNRTRSAMVEDCMKNSTTGNYGKTLHEFEDSSIDMDASFKSNISLNIKPNFNISFNASIPLKNEIRQLTRRRKAFLNAMKTIYSYIVSFLLFSSLISAFKYHSKYLKNLNYDNIYITAYFDHIDQRRGKRDKITVLPLKDLDRRSDLIRPNRLKQGPAEKKRTRTNFVIWFLVLVVIVNILYLDHLMSFAIASFTRHGNVTFRDTGSHNVSFEVIGTGPFAQALRESYRDFNITETLDSSGSSGHCLPIANYVSLADYFLIGFIIMLWFLLNFTDAYLLRLKRSICAYFYPERERERNLHLYNQVLRSRKKGLKYMLNRYHKDKAYGRIDERKLQDVCQLCQEPVAEEDALVCEVCDENKHVTIYCKQCWTHAVRQHCLVCSDWRKAESMMHMKTEDKASVWLKPAEPENQPAVKK